MSVARKIRPAATAPACIEDQHQQAVAAQQHAQALEADALHALDAAFAAFVTNPGTDTATTYAAAHAHHAGIADLVHEVKAFSAEVREALERHRAAEADAPRRAAEAARDAARRRVWDHHANADRLLVEEIQRQSAALPMGVMTGGVRITAEQIDAGLSRFVRHGQPGEPAFVVRDAEGFAAFLRKHAREWLQGGENATTAIRRALGGDVGLADPRRVTLSASAAQAPAFASPSFGGVRR